MPPLRESDNVNTRDDRNWLFTTPLGRVTFVIMLLAALLNAWWWTKPDVTIDHHVRLASPPASRWSQAKTPGICCELPPGWTFHYAPKPAGKAGVALDERGNSRLTMSLYFADPSPGKSKMETMQTEHYDQVHVDRSETNDRGPHGEEVHYVFYFGVHEQTVVIDKADEAELDPVIRRMVQTLRGCDS